MKIILISIAVLLMLAGTAVAQSPPSYNVTQTTWAHPLGILGAGADVGAQIKVRMLNESPADTLKFVKRNRKYGKSLAFDSTHVWLVLGPGISYDLDNLRSDSVLVITTGTSTRLQFVREE